MNCNDGLITIRNLNFDVKDEYINVYFFQTNNDTSKLRFEEQDIVNETKIRLDKKDVDNILERKHNEARSANMVRAGYYMGPGPGGPGRPGSAPLPPPQPMQHPHPHPHPQPMHPHPHPHPQPPQPMHPSQQYLPRNMMPPNHYMQRRMGSMGSMGGMRRW